MSAAAPRGLALGLSWEHNFYARPRFTDRAPAEHAAGRSPHAQNTTRHTIMVAHPQRGFMRQVCVQKNSPWRPGRPLGGGTELLSQGGLRRGIKLQPLLTFVLGSQPVLSTSTCVVAWPQGDQLLSRRASAMWQMEGPASTMGAKQRRRATGGGAAEGTREL